MRGAWSGQEDKVGSKSVDGNQEVTKKIDRKKELNRDQEVYQAVRKEKIVTMETNPERLDESGNISVKAKFSLNKTYRVQSTTDKPIED